MVSRAAECAGQFESVKIAKIIPTTRMTSSANFRMICTNLISIGNGAFAFMKLLRLDLLNGTRLMRRFRQTVSEVSSSSFRISNIASEDAL